MEQIEFIQATANDATKLADIQLSFSEEFHGQHSDELRNQLRESWTNFYTREMNKSYLSWYATVNGIPASAGGLCIRVQPGNVKNPSGKWGYLFGIYTLPAYRRKGLSREIVSRLIASAREHGITALELHATKAGEPLYIQSGFVQHNEPTYRQFLNP